MLDLEWIPPTFEIIKIHAVGLKIGYTFCTHAVSAEILCGLRTLFPVFVLKTTFFLKYSFSLKNDFSLAKERGYRAIIAWQNCFIANFGFIFLLFKSPNSVNMKVDGVFNR